MNAETAGRISAWVRDHRERSVEFLKDLVRINSTVIRHGLDGNEAAAQAFVRDYLSQRGMEVHAHEPDCRNFENAPAYSPGHSYVNRPNVVGIARGSGGGRSLILNGHIDTMEPQYLDRWTHDPFDPVIEDGKLYGVGACDMKAGLAALMMALEAVSGSGVRLKGDVIVESVVDEEGGGNGSLDLCARGYRADGAIIAEPTELHLQPASRGVLLLEVRVEGRPTHACLKWEGVNAIEKALGIISAMREMEREWLATRTHPLLPRPTVGLGQIEGGVASSAVPGECVMRFDLKYLPSQYDLRGERTVMDGEAIKREVADRIMGVCRADPWLAEHPPKLSFYQHCIPHEIPADDELVRTMGSAAREVMGQAHISGFPAGCDARHFAMHGIPAVIFGPGDLRHAHNVDEHVSVEDYLRCLETVARTIVAWCGEQ
ncbi:MAG: ArgE/DapE family deacylase [Spirochaetales bacterium]|nr:ArgE/DapE family deacylase [Spirochaetales bacterium]